MPMPLIKLPPRPTNLRFDVPQAAGGGFQVQADASGGTILAMGYIGEEITTASVIEGLHQIGPRPVTVQVNSRGGDAFEGIGIYNVLRQHPAPVTVEVLGAAFSAASIIAMAATDGRLLMARNSQLMAHRASVLAIGNAGDLRQFASILDRTDAALAATYAARADMSEADAAELMAAETFLSAPEAIALGLADGLLDQDATPAPEAARNLRINSKADLTQRLHQIGLAKGAAAKIAAHGWAGLSGEDSEETDDGLDLARIAAALNDNLAATVAAFA